MSYILDALKKSDQERKQGDVPNLQTIHIPVNTEPKAPLGLYGFIVFLLLALAFVIGLVIANKAPPGIVAVPDSSDESLNRSETQPVKQPTKQILNHSVPASVPEPVSGPVKKAAIAKPLINQNAKINESHKVKVKPDKTADDFNQQKRPQADQTNQSEQMVRQENEGDSNEIKKGLSNLKDIPYLHELPDYLQQSVPQMSFAGHVYSSDGQNRSVIINDVFMSEGDSVLPGIDVIEITPAGVVFSLHDDYFRVDILQDWSFE